MEAQLAATSSAATSSPPRSAPRVRFAVTGDERLARLVAEGSDGAFEAVYARYHQPLFRLCRSLVGNDADAQDALQSAFTGALVALRQGRRDAPLRPWLYRIAHNESISLLRRRRPEVELPEQIGPPGRSAHDVAEERVRLATLISDLRELPDQQRGALVMRELSGLPHEEVAAALGITVGAAKQTVLEARRSLAEFAEGRSMSCNEIQRLVSDGDRRMLRGRRVRAHLRGCSGCATFAEAIPQRRADLLALSPALPALAAGGLLARITGGAAHAHSGSGGLGLAAGAAGKGLGTAMSVKALATTVAVVASAAAGTAGVVHLVTTKAPASSPAAGASGTHRVHGAGHGTAARGAGTHATATGRSSAAALRAAHGRGAGHAGTGQGAQGDGAANGRGATNGQGGAGGHGAKGRGAGHGAGAGPAGHGNGVTHGVTGHAGATHGSTSASSHRHTGGSSANPTARSKARGSGSSKAGSIQTSSSNSGTAGSKGKGSSKSGGSSKTTTTATTTATTTDTTPTASQRTSGPGVLGITLPPEQASGK